jgi:hypothetical protein
VLAKIFQIEYILHMEITEEKIRQITKEAQYHLGPNTNPTMLKKVVKEVVRRLLQESTKKNNLTSEQE